MARPVAPSHQGKRLPDDPFPPEATIYLEVNGPEIKAEKVSVIAKDLTYANFQAFSDFGNASTEQIWSFESRTLALQLAVWAALAAKLEETCPTSRTGWQAKIGPLKEALISAQESARTLCDLVHDTVDK